VLNWLSRYAPALAALEQAGELGSVLDVGCGPHGLACVRPDLPFVGVDVAFDGPPTPTMVAFRAPAGPLPFGDAAFDSVLCLDVLEHLPPADRPGFVAELARVAARRVLVACPTTAAQPLDDRVRRQFVAAGAPIPGWLSEHDEHGLPARDEVAAWAAAVAGFEPTAVPMANDLLCTIAVLADLDNELAARVTRDLRTNASDWTQLLETATFGDSFRDAWLLERATPAEALVKTTDLRGSATAALRGAATPVGAPPPSAPVRLDTRASRKLWLAPAWEHPERWVGALSAYLHAARPEEPVCLALDATTGDLGPDAVTSLVAEACERLAGDAAFAEVLIVDTPVADRELIPVTDADSVRAALGAAASPIPDDPDEVVARARWAKALVDDLRATADRLRFERAADPFAEDRPLVTVRIPTWNGVEGLVGRAIPSVLGGSYANVEVLVCSDGPDPRARTAVEAIPDPRVRYLELDQRPAHPSHPWSFWETTGLRPANHALDQARGAFICPLDHDDAFTSTHVADLLEVACGERADLVHGQALCEQPAGPPVVLGAPQLRHGQVTHGSVMYSRRLAHMRYDTACWLIGEPGDWNLWRRMLAAGAVTAHLPKVVLAHSRERTSIEDDPRTAQLGRRSAADLAPDVLGTDARALLDIAPLLTCAPTS
jgi:hypothetical protein